MIYLNTIKTGLLIFPFIAIIFTIPFVLSNYHRYGSISVLRSLIIYSFILYLIIIYFLVILPLPSIEYVSSLNTPYFKLIPFYFINDIKNHDFLAIMITLFNLVMFIPFGMYLHYYFKCSFKHTLLYSFLLSLFFELTQLSGLYFIYPRPYRLFDVDDLIVNTTGGILGYILVIPLMKILPSRNTIDNNSLIKGLNVSGLRRVCIFLLDLFNYLLIISILSSYFDFKLVSIIVFIIYYIIIPTISSYTLGSYYLKVKIVFNKFKLIKYILRSVFIMFYYIYFYYFLIEIEYYLCNIYNINSKYMNYIIVITFVIGILIDIISLLKVISGKYLIYDKLINTKYISTIKYRSDKDE